jgi:hypothetical protein
MTITRERSDRRAQGIFDVRDAYRERQVDDGLPARIDAPTVFAVLAVVTPAGQFEPADWRLDTRRTISGLSVFLDRITQGRRSEVIRTLPESTTQVDLQVISPSFQAADLTIRPGDVDPYHPVLLEPAVDYPFGAVTTRPDELGPSLLRSAVLDEGGAGVAGAVVAVAEGLYTYRTGSDGSWVIVIPDNVSWQPNPVVPALQVEVAVTLAPGPWQTATVLPDPVGPAWTGNGLVKTCTVTAERGVTVSVPALRLRLT